MALVQFEPDLKRLMSRYKQKLDPDLQKAFVKIDKIAKRIAEKGLPVKEKEEQANKLKDAFKKLKVAIKKDMQDRGKDFADAQKEAQKKKEKFDVTSASRVVVNVNRELLILQNKVMRFVENGGNPPPPPKLPELHFGADYKSIIIRNEGTLAPSVVSALDKLDENSDAQKVMALTKAAREALEKQIATLNGLAAQCRDQKEKVQITTTVKELTDFRKEIKNFETRVFLIHRLKG